MTTFRRCGGVLAIVVLVALVGGRGRTAIHAQTLGGVTLTVNLTADDLLALGPSTPARLLGRWTIAFDATGGYTVGRATNPTRGIELGVEAPMPTVLVTGLWQLSGDDLTLTDLSGPLACPDEQATGTYTVATDGVTYSFAAVDDGCPGRTILLTARPFTAPRRSGVFSTRGPF
jgi:hypothetical protein